MTLTYLAGRRKPPGMPIDIRSPAGTQSMRLISPGDVRSSLEGGSFVQNNNNNNRYWPKSRCLSFWSAVAFAALQRQAGFSRAKMRKKRMCFYLFTLIIFVILSFLANFDVLDSNYKHRVR